MDRNCVHKISCHWLRQANEGGWVKFRWTRALLQVQNFCSHLMGMNLITNLFTYLQVKCIMCWKKGTTTHLNSVWSTRYIVHYWFCIYVYIVLCVNSVWSMRSIVHYWVYIYVYIVFWGSGAETFVYLPVERVHQWCTDLQQHSSC